MKSQCTFNPVDNEVNIHQCMFCGQRVKSTFKSNQIHSECLKQEIPVSKEVKEERKKICHQCSHFNIKSRCAMIDLGCIHTYLRFLRSAERTCPLGLWPQIFQDFS